MQVVIEIDKSEFTVKSGTSAKTGKPYSIREQMAYLHVPGQKYPQQFKLVLPDEQPGPYPAGRYHLDPTSIFVGRFDDLQIKPRLVPTPSNTAATSRPV